MNPPRITVNELWIDAIDGGGSVWRWSSYKTFPNFFRIQYKKDYKHRLDENYNFNCLQMANGRNLYDRTTSILNVNIFFQHSAKGELIIFVKFFILEIRESGGIQKIILVFKLAILSSDYCWTDFGTHTQFDIKVADYIAWKSESLLSVLGTTLGRVATHNQFSHSDPVPVWPLAICISRGTFCFKRKFCHTDLDRILQHPVPQSQTNYCATVFKFLKILTFGIA